MEFITGTLYRELLLAAYSSLSKHFQEINDLNVFPVPDGDTGTNRKLTFQSGLSYLEETDNLEQASSSFAKGRLFGARGNSGVLVSRYFYGLSLGFKGMEKANLKDFSSARVLAYQTAYAAVKNPQEGTILTVAREGIDTIKDHIDYEKASLVSFFSQVIDARNISLENTPNLLPVLKESGVIDSGGKGLLTIFQGFLSYFSGNNDFEAEPEHSSAAPIKYDFSAFNENSTLDYGYCTEFLLQLLNSKADVHQFNLDSFIHWRNENGSSLVCFQNGTIVKVHIHTKTPWVVIRYAQQFGEFLTFKRENRALQHNNVEKKKAEKKKLKKKYAVIAIAQGKDIIDTFKSRNCDIVLDGGKTRNTSTEELIHAFQEANAEQIILLPDEKNIFMAAHQAAEIYTESHVRVVQTATIPAGYACLSLRCGGEENPEEIFETRKEEAKHVNSFFLCKAVRDTLVDEVTCVQGNYIGGLNGHLKTCSKNLKEGFLSLLNSLDGIKDKERLYFFTGKNVTDSLTNEITAEIQKRYPNLEILPRKGNQDVYDIMGGID